MFKRSVLSGVFPFNGWHRFLPILVHCSGARTLELPVNHRPRVAGTSKYGIWDRLGRGIIDLMAMAWYQRRRMTLVPTEQLDPPQPGAEPATQAGEHQHAPALPPEPGAARARSGA